MPPKNGDTGWTAILATPCSGMEKNNRILNWPPSRPCHPQILTEPRTLVNLGVASSGLCYFLTVESSGLSFKGVASSGLCCFFSFLAHREIRGGKNSSPLCIVIVDEVV